MLGLKQLPIYSWAYMTLCKHHSDVIMSMMAWWHLKSLASRLFAQPFVQAQIKENFKASHHWLFVRRIHQWPVDSPHKGTVMQKIIPFDDVIMNAVVSIGSCLSHVSRNSRHVHVPLEWPYLVIPVRDSGYWACIANGDLPCVYIYMYICRYIYIYVYVYVYMYMDIYTL